ncbi:MAG: DUF2834 domain-containing protein [Algiphilus sp.]|uniref:DUF2834 domain-containing protein n=1 Tax=Algiphilus sp. TaxID=1872431 RepID=UPI002A6940F0|nr:DUF2834 domain-containing protein [Pseudomonadota bacterium]
MKPFYGVMCVLGVVLPWGAFAPWLIQHGIDLGLLWQTMRDSPVAAFAWLDVIVSALVLIAFIVVEGRRRQMRRLYLPVLATCGVGVSLGLPLFLWMRECQKPHGNAQPDVAR